MENQSRKESLFNIFRRKDTKQKLIDLQIWLERGADINSLASHKNNTILHIAVMRGEVELIKMILEKGANTSQQNSNGKTALDLALLLKIRNKQEIIRILKPYYRGKSKETSLEHLNQSDTAEVNSLLEDHNDATSNEFLNQESNTPFLYVKRLGTSGIGGQLYESKLLSLFLLRVLNHKHITRFNLGTNIEGIGAIDDIVLQYEINGEEIPKVLFIQAKHKDEPEQNKITVQDLFREHGDYCLHKYFDSYLRIRGKFGSNNKQDCIFKHAFKDVDCDFIIYTPAMENIGDNKIIVQGNSEKNHSLLLTSETGKIFRLNYSDFEVQRLLLTALEVRAQLLGKTFMKFLLKENYKNLLMDFLIKTYHVFLTHHVVEVASKETLEDLHLEATFRKSFLKSNDTYLRILREAIYKEFSIKYSNYSLEHIIDEVTPNFNFKLPLNFGNLNFSIAGNSVKVQKKLVYISSKIKQLINSAESCGPYLVVKIDDSVVGPATLLHEKDLEMYRLGGLVGNLFIFDEDTFQFKFNEHIESLPSHVKRLYQILKNEYPEGKRFNNYRFDFHVCNFPKLSLGPNEYELTLVKEFLDKLVFYTNQACEEEVEKVLKSEIIKCYKLNSYREKVCRMKCESIFLKVHDTIQKWWKQPDKAPYLDENYKYYEDAKEQLINVSILNTLHFLYTTKLNSYGIQFKDIEQQFNVLDDIHLQGVLNIVTNNITFTSIKLIQYLNHNNDKYFSYIFLNLDFIVSENCFDDVIAELRQLNVTITFVTCENNKVYYNSIKQILNLVKESVVLITKQELRDLNCIQYLRINDNKNELIDLTLESQRKIISETKINFQGYTTPINQIIKDNFNIMGPEILFAIINKENIQIGRKIITNAKFEDFEDYYVQRTINRCIKLKTKINCGKYADRQSFKKNLFHSVEHIEEYKIDRPESCQHESYKPKTLLDIAEKVIILSAPPGTGKSTFVSYLSTETKRTDPHYWILRINCLDYKESLNHWQETNTEINLKVIIKFLYNVACQLDNNADDLNVNVGSDDNILIEVPNNGKFSSLQCLEIELFNNLYNNEQIVIIFDGVDEISPDYFNTVVKILDIMKNSKVKRLWITTRPYNIVHTLEQKLGTLVFMFDKLCPDDQEDLFQALIMQKCHSRKIRYLGVSLKKLIHDEDFTSTPLNIFLLAEIIDEMCKGKKPIYPCRFNLLKMYEMFVDIKYSKILLAEKRPYFSNADPELKEMMKMNHKAFIEIHKKLAAHVLFKKNVQGLFSAHDMEDIHNALERVSRGEVRAGIIDNVVDGEAQFIHLTFAEYFATEYFCDKLKSVECSLDVWLYFFDTIIIADKFSRVKQFFHLKLAADNDLYKLAENHKYKEDIFGLLLKQPVKNSLYYAIIGKLTSEHMALFLLQCVKGVLTNNNLGAFLQYIINFVSEFISYEGIYYSWIEYGYHHNVIEEWHKLKLVLNTVFEWLKAVDNTIFPDLFSCKEYAILVQYYFIAVAFELDDTITISERHWLDVMLSTVEDDILLDCFTTSHHYVPEDKIMPHLLAIRNEKTRFFFKYLLRLDQDQLFNVFYTFDFDSQLAAHWAVKENNLEFFAAMACLLDDNNFITICITCDDQGVTPIGNLLNKIQLCVQRNIHNLNLLPRWFEDNIHETIMYCFRFNASFIFINIGLKLLLFLFYTFCLNFGIKIGNNSCVKRNLLVSTSS